MTYFSNIKRGIRTTLKGMSLTLKHFWAARHTKGPVNVQDSSYFKIDTGYVTLQYPHETITVPDHGRYQLDCEIDDCIVCDKCAKICPVNCIEIEAIKSPELIRTTSDGSPVRLHAAKFDIDLAKCCFCGLCTTVCPTECLTMNSEYDYSVLDIRDLNFTFSNLSEEEVKEKQDLYNTFLAEKEQAKLLAKTEQKPEEILEKSIQPIFKPKNPNATENNEISLKEGLPKPFLPKIKAVTDSEKVVENSKEEGSSKKAPFIPKLKPPVQSISDEVSNEPAVETKKPVGFVPKMKPPVTKTEEVSKEQTEGAKKPSGFVPKMKPLVAKTEQIAIEPTEEPKKPSGFVPKMKPPVAKTEQIAIEPTEEAKKPSGFVPKMKPPIAKTEQIAIEPTEEPKKPSGFIPKMKPKQ